jgi:transcriptional regulator with XRE-family HTH domain
MITNERQLQLARAEIERFQEALDGDVVEFGIDPIILNAQRQALKSQLDELNDEVDEYLKLKSGAVRTFNIENLAELPRVLINSRIASGMTQRELADRLSLKEQQIQRYETQGYEGASFSRIADVANAIGLNVPGTLVLAETHSIDAVIKRAAVAGVESQFIRRRIAPGGDARAVAERLGYVFDWSPDTIFATTPLELPEIAGATARFKMPKGRNARAVAAYTAYVHRLAEICADAMPMFPPQPIPIEAKPMIELIGKRGEVDFSNALETAWDLGVIVLPLADSGQFHGACWRFAGTNVVVLKQGEKSAAKWLVDLLHEMFHAGRFPEDPDFEVIEESETAESRRTDPEEIQATWFASLVSTNGQAEELFKAIISETDGDLRFLKSAVARKATATGLDAGVVANYVAHRLSLQGENWWGTAANLQDRSIDPLDVARNTFFRRFDFSKLDTTALELLQLALHDEVQDG